MSRASLACVVDSDPAPDCIALNIAMTSPPRTSPTMMRSRLKRRRCSNRSSSVIAPARRPCGPNSPEPGRASSAIGSRARPCSCRNTSYSVSSVPTDSHGSRASASALTNVVLPEPWAPETTMDFRARTAAARNCSSVWSTVPTSRRVASVTWVSRCLRIRTTGRCDTSMIAASLARPPRLRCKTGLALEKARSPPPRCAARNAMNSMSSSSESATGGPTSRRPSAYSSSTLSWPVISMFSTSGRSTSGCSRPSPKRLSKTAAASACSSSRSIRPVPSRASARAWSSSKDRTIDRPSSRRSSSSTPALERSCSASFCEARWRNVRTSDQSTALAS